jgi:hypothetical protein
LPGEEGVYGKEGAKPPSPFKVKVIKEMRSKI